MDTQEIQQLNRKKKKKEKTGKRAGKYMTNLLSLKLRE
jgi:hypothetical protein